MLIENLRQNVMGEMEYRERKNYHLIRAYFGVNLILNRITITGITVAYIVMFCGKFI